MSLDVMNLQTQTAKLGVYRTLDGRTKPEDDLNIVYFPYATTADGTVEAGQLIDGENMEDLAMLSIEATVKAVESWDLTNKGVPVPVSAEGILEAKVPQRVLQEIGEAIAKATKRNAGKPQGIRRLRG